MIFKDLKFRTHAENDVQAWTEVNGYEVSIIRNALSHGGDKGLYEIGVFNAAGSMCDPCEWGDDVKGWLNESDVEHWLNYIKRL
jgi:hypothetical protein